MCHANRMNSITQLAASSERSVGRKRWRGKQTPEEMRETNTEEIHETNTEEMHETWL